MRLNVFATAAGLAAGLAALGPSPAGAQTPTPASAPAPAQPAAQTRTDPLHVLIAQGKYWQAHRRGDLAEQAWTKVLRIDPKQPDALFGMGIVLADRHDGAGAQRYLAQLRAVAPDYPDIDELRRRLGESSQRDQFVADARRLAEAGQSASAVQAYQRALAGRPATPELQLEYDQALAATPQGWDEARRGLEDLARAHPEDPRYALALAQHLTYREATRRDGIAQLARLAGDSTVGAAAKRSWRQALLWLGARASDAALYQAYLRTAPDDAAVKARYEGMVAQDRATRERAEAGAANSARGRAIADGFAALDRGDTAAARAKFSAVLANAPEDADALGGLGVAALKEEHFEQARNYLERASRAGNPARWKDALTSATYWAYTSEGIGARSNGQVAKAKSLFERAIQINPSDVTAQNLLGETLLNTGDPRGAEQAYRMALRRQADNPDAIRGLVGALAAQGRGDEALQFANQLNAEQQAKTGGIDRLRGTALAAQARAAEARGDLGTARSLFEDALPTNPDDPWLRLDLARIYVREGATASARSMMDGLLATHPDMPDALYASALLSADTQDWSTGLRQLERVPPAQRSAAMTTLQHRLWVHQQADLATRLARQGNLGGARATLAAAEPVAGADAELRGTLASAWLAAGDPGQALALMRGALATAPADPGLLLQYAGVLLATQQEAELGDVMRRLSAAQLTPSQHADFERLNLAIVIKQADAIRLRGDLAAAYDAISPWLAAMPDDPDLQAMLARLYTSAGDNGHALASYRTALARRPDDSGLLVAALYAAAGAKDFRYGEQLANAALRGAPNDPAVLAALGRFYRAEGKLSLAATYLQRSLLVANAPAGANVGASNAPPSWAAAMRRLGATPLPGTNPFAGKTAVDLPGGGAGASGSAPGAPQPMLPSPSFYPSRTVPTYLPPTAPSVPATSYLAPSAALSTALPAAPAPVAGGGDYGPDAAGTSQSGAPQGDAPAYAQGYAPAYAQAPVPAYGQGYAQAQAPAYAQSYAPPPYGAQPAPAGYGAYPAAPGGGNYTPWPMSPAAQQAQAAARPLPDVARKSAGKSTRATRKSAAARVAQAPYGAQPQPGYGGQPAYYGQPAGYPAQPPYAPAYGQAQQPYAPQPAPAYAPQPYAQQPYPPLPYAPQPYAQQQPYVPQPPASYAAQPYIPQPPAGYAPQQPYAQAQAPDYGAAAQAQPAAGAGGAANAPQSQTLGVAAELADINREQASTVSGGVVFRNRAGENGLSNLTDIEAPIEGRVRAGNGHLVITATPVMLDSGTAAGDLPTRARFGSGLSTSSNPTGSFGAQNASGVGLALGYETRSVQADVGVTPVGFRETNLVGGLKYQGGITDKTSYSLAVARRAVTDSLLSYAGARDASTGQEWGGVTSSGARASLDWDDGTSGLYVNGEFQYLDGHHVESNYGGKGGGGVYTRIYNDADQMLTVGVNTTLMRYTKNQSYFTYGQGGYFSPQQYVILNLPVEYKGRNGGFTYDVKGSIGVQHYRLDAANYFPLDPGLQQAAASNMSTATGPGVTLDSNAVYPGQSKTGISYSFAASGEYQLAPQLAFGATAALGNAYQYREWLAAFYVRYSFSPQTGLQPFPPRTLTSPYLADQN